MEDARAGGAVAASGVRRRTGGRSARVRHAVGRTVLELIETEGVAAITFARVGEASGVHPSSISRRWGSVERLVLDAIAGETADRVAIPEGASFADDVHANVAAAARYLNSPQGLALIRALATADDSPQMRRERSAAVEVRFAPFRAMVERAIARGEAPADLEPRRVLEMLTGPLLARALLMHEPIDDGTVEQVSRTVLAGLRATASRE